MKTIKKLLTPLALLALTTTLSFGTVYSDGEDGTTTGWRVYDNSPSGATIENSYDETKQSKVIVLNGEKRKNAYMIGDKKNSKGWKNSTELTMKWSMNFSEKFKISVYLKTKKGNRVLYYDEKNSDKGFYKKKYIRLGLGLESKSEKWIDITRNLEADLQKHEPSNYIKIVSGFKIQGSGRIDNLELINDNGQPIGDLQISNIEVIKLKDDYTKIAWKLNHKATGQVEYGTTTDYGNFSNKEDSFKLTYHRQSLRGLEAGTTYHYRVISEDEAGNRAVSEDKTFRTTGGTTGSNIFPLKKWSNQATLANGQTIEATIQDHSEKHDDNYTVIIKDITDPSNPSILSKYQDQFYSFGQDGLIEKGGVIQVSDNGTRLYIMKNHPDLDNEMHSMIIYDISTPSNPIKLSQNYLHLYIWNTREFNNTHYITSSDHIHILNKDTLLLRGSDGEYEHPCYDEKIYAKVVDITDGSHPNFSQSYDYSSAKLFEGCEEIATHFSIDQNSQNHSMEVVSSRDKVWTVHLQGKPYTAFIDKDSSTSLYVALGHQGVEIINYKTDVSQQLISSDIFAKYIVKISDHKLLIFNDTEYQYITY